MKLNLEYYKGYYLLKINKIIEIYIIEIFGFHIYILFYCDHIQQPHPQYQYPYMCYYVCQVEHPITYYS